MHALVAIVVGMLICRMLGALTHADAGLCTRSRPRIIAGVEYRGKHAAMGTNVYPPMPPTSCATGLPGSESKAVAEVRMT